MRVRKLEDGGAEGRRRARDARSLRRTRIQARWLRAWRRNSHRGRRDGNDTTNQLARGWGSGARQRADRHADGGGTEWRRAQRNGWRSLAAAAVAAYALAAHPNLAPAMPAPLASESSSAARRER